MIQLEVWWTCPLFLYGVLFAIEHKQHGKLAMVSKNFTGIIQCWIKKKTI